MYWILLLLFFWVASVAWTYSVFYYESANSAHLEVLRSRGSVAVLLVKGFFWSLYGHVMMLATAVTAVNRAYYSLPAGSAGRTPVVFVHGLYHNHTAWCLYLRWFRKWGWEHLKTVKLKGKFRSIQDYRQILDGQIDQVLSQTGSTKVDLVGHSMGGLVIRSYLTGDDAKTKVRRVVTLGSPHQGSKLAVFGVGRAVKEMVPNSAFLDDLNRTIQMPQQGHFYTIYTILDNMVLPNESAILTADRMSAVETRPIDHVSLVYCKHTADLVRQCLESSQE